MTGLGGEFNWPKQLSEEFPAEALDQLPATMFR